MNLKKIGILITSMFVLSIFTNKQLIQAVNYEEDLVVEKSYESVLNELSLLEESDIPDVIEYSIASEKGHCERIIENENLNSFVFNNIDGTQSQYIFNHPVKYIDDSGNLQDILMQIEENEYGSGYIPVSSDVNVCFNKILSDGIALNYYDDVNVSMIPNFGNVDFTYAILSDDKEKVTYNCDNNIDIEYSLIYQGIKENIILNEYTGTNEFTFNLKTNGLKLTSNETETLSLYKDNVAVADFSEIIITDSNNIIDIGKIYYEIVEENEEYLLTVVVDEAFLLDEDTVYPVYIDPTIKIKYRPDKINGEFSISHATIYDNDEYSPNGTMYLGNVNGVKSRVIMRFPGFIGDNNLENINFNNMKSAKLYIKAIGYGYDNGEFNISCHYYKRNWNISLLSNYNWNYFGSDESFDTNEISSQVVSEVIGKSKNPIDTYEFDITSFVKGTNMSTNRSLIFKADDVTENTKDKYCMFSSYRSGNNAPYVVIDYEVPHIYEYQEDAPISYTYRNRIYLNAGNTYIFETEKATSYSNCDTEMFLFKDDMSPNNSWYNDDISTSSPVNRYSRIEADISDSGYYILMVKRYDNLKISGSSPTGYCNVYQIDAITKNKTLLKENAQLGGYKMVLSKKPSTYTTVYNSFTTDLNNCDTIMYVVTESSGTDEKRIVGYNDDYSSYNEGDFQWGRASRIKQKYQYNTVPAYLFISNYSTNSTGTADIYALCKSYDSSSVATIKNIYPNFKLDDYIVADEGTDLYNCISYSGGITYQWNNLNLNGSNPNILSPWYDENEITILNNYYGNNPPRYIGATTYTLTENSNDAVINVYKNGDNWTHASVRAPANNQPHGYAWESKLGSGYRVFHPIDALNNDDVNSQFAYGHIELQYKIDDSNNISLSDSDNSESIIDNITFDESVSMGLTKIQNVNIDLENPVLQLKISLIPLEIIDEFENLYEIWKYSIENNEMYDFVSIINYTDTSEYDELSDFIDDNDTALLYLIMNMYLENPHDEFISTLFSDKIVYRNDNTINLANTIRENNNRISLHSLDDDVYISPSFETNAFCFIDTLLSEDILSSE